jgi:hypothetical protein
MATEHAQPRHTAASKRQVATIALATAAYVVAASLFAVLNGNGEFAFYIVVMLALMAAVYGMHRSVGLSAPLLWCLSAWGLMHMAGGLLHLPASWPTDNGSVLYNLWLIPDLLKYDQLVHALGFGITTWLCWQGLSAAMAEHAGNRPQATFGLMVLCAAGGMGFGAFNEVVEFIATLTLPQTNVGGYTNTGWDLVANLVGSTLAAALIAWRS